MLKGALTGRLPFADPEYLSKDTGAVAPTAVKETCFQAEVTPRKGPINTGYLTEKKVHLPQALPSGGNVCASSGQAQEHTEAGVPARLTGHSSVASTYTLHTVPGCLMQLAVQSWGSGAIPHTLPELPGREINR